MLRRLPARIQLRGLAPRHTLARCRRSVRDTQLKALAKYSPQAQISGSRPTPISQRVEERADESLAENLERIPARNKPPAFENQYFLTDLGRFSGIVSHVEHRDTEFVIQRTKLLENAFL